MSAKTLVATTLFVAALTSHAHAQPNPAPKNGRVTIPVFLKPNDYLKPVSRAYLLPQYSESIPGNQVQMFLRCFMERSNLFGREESEKQEKWNEMPLNALPLNEVANYGGLLGRDAYDAARMTQADWQLWSFIRRDGFNTLLPDVQKMRALASIMKIRVRAEIASGDNQAAIRSFRTLFGLGRTFDAHPSLIGHLVGVAISTIACDALEEFIQRPNTPSLYWALMDLPKPFMSLRLGTEGERLMLSFDVEPLKTASDATSSEVMTHVERIHNLLLTAFQQKQNNAFVKSDPTSDYKSMLLEKTKNAAEVNAARDRVVQLGGDPLFVKKWSPLHVILLDDILHCELYRDEMAKYMNLPYWQAKEGMDKAVAEINEKTKEWPSLALVPSMVRIKQGQTRLDQRLAYLQVMEAIRLHAFQNGGSLPATLAEIKLPLPVDPVTGKPFEYKLDKGVATLHGENPQPQTEQTNRYYEILLSK